MASAVQKKYIYCRMWTLNWDCPALSNWSSETLLASKSSVLICCLWGS